jgi:hypothetical protein
MEGYPTRILNEPLNVSSTLYYQGSPVNNSNPLPCSLGDGTVTITGDITIPATISVYSSSSNPVHVHIVESIPITLNDSTCNIGNVNINGTVPVSLCNMPISTTLINQLPSGSNTIGNVNININNSLVSNSNPFPVSFSTTPTVNIIPTKGASDAFGRTRVSEPYTLGDYKHIYGIDPNFQDKYINGGSNIFNKNKACCMLYTTTASNSYVLHQTKRYHQYLPGKSQLILSSFNFNGFTSNVIKRTGLYDDNDGIYFELDGLNRASFNIRSFVTGTPINVQVFQKDWNIDKLNSLSSSFILDLTKVQLFFVDFQWLGVGRVRCGFAHDGDFIIAHEFYHSNRISAVYMSSPSLPIRCEIFNTNTTLTGSTMDQICSTVISEGGYFEVGYDGAVTSDIRTITAGLYNSLPVLCIALSSTYKGYINRMIARLTHSTVFAIDNNVMFQILKLPSVSNVIGGQWLDIDINTSGLKYNKTATSITSVGIQLANGFVSAAQNGSSGVNIIGSSSETFGTSTRTNFIAQNIDGNDSEVYVIYAKTLTASVTQLIASIQWREVY